MLFAGQQTSGTAHIPPPGTLFTTFNATPLFRSLSLHHLPSSVNLTRPTSCPARDFAGCQRWPNKSSQFPAAAPQESGEFRHA